MGKEIKWMDPNSPTVARLRSEVPPNHIAYYPVSTFPSGILSDNYLAKTFQVAVAVSGSPAEGADWMGIFPYRVDYGQPRLGVPRPKVRDLDPAVFLFDSGTGTPRCSGLTAYHQTFDRRTLPIPGYETSSLSNAVMELRQIALSGVWPLDAAPLEVQNGLPHMANLLKRHKPILGSY